MVAPWRKIHRISRAQYSVTKIKIVVNVTCSKKRSIRKAIHHDQSPIPWEEHDPSVFRGPLRTNPMGQKPMTNHRKPDGMIHAILPMKNRSGTNASFKNRSSESVHWKKTINWYSYSLQLIVFWNVLFHLINFWHTPFHWRDRMITHRELLPTSQPSNRVLLIEDEFW